VRQLAVFQSRPVSRLRYTQLGVLARPLTRTCIGCIGEVRRVVSAQSRVHPSMVRSAMACGLLIVDVK
jgi:hypothetical protein